MTCSGKVEEMGVVLRASDLIKMSIGRYKYLMNRYVGFNQNSLFQGMESLEFSALFAHFEAS